MKKLFFTTLFAGFISLCSAQVTALLGEWVTIADKTGEQQSVVTIYQANDGKYYGKITQMLVGNGHEICTACTGEDKDKPLEGLVIIREMKENKGELSGGKVLDPESGKFYYGKIYLKDGNLVLRGSLDKMGMLGRSQTWKRK